MIVKRDSKNRGTAASQGERLTIPRECFVSRDMTGCQNFRTPTNPPTGKPKDPNSPERKERRWQYRWHGKAGGACHVDDTHVSTL